jgi:hypothetical protein
VGVRLRVHACLRTLQLAAFRCNIECGSLQAVSVRCSLREGLRICVRRSAPPTITSRVVSAGQVLVKRRWKTMATDGEGEGADEALLKHMAKDGKAWQWLSP